MAQKTLTQKFNEGKIITNPIEANCILHIVDRQNFTQNNPDGSSFAITLENLKKKPKNTIVVNQLSDFPTPIASNITLADSTTYIIGSLQIDMGSNSITFGNNSAIIGIWTTNSILKFDGTGSKIISNNQNVCIENLTLWVPEGQLFEARNIDYAINPAVDPFQGRSKFFRVINCILQGDLSGGNGGDLGFVEGFGTINFNSNFVRKWNVGLKVSNGLSLEAINNKVVLWNQQGADMLTLRNNNWSNQTNTTGSYIPTGINALIITGNIFHPKNNEFAYKIETGHTTEAGTITGNTLILSGNTTGGILNTNNAQDYNDLTTFTIQNNKGGQDNSTAIQSFLGTGAIAQTQLTVNTPTQINLSNLVKSSENQFLSQRVLMSQVIGFEVGEIVLGQTSANKGKIRSIDTTNNYLYLDYIIDSNSNPGFFTVGEILTGQNTSTTGQYNGVDGALKYSGTSAIKVDITGNMSVEKFGNQTAEYNVFLYKNGVAVEEFNKLVSITLGEINQVSMSGLLSLSGNEIIEIFIENTTDSDNIAIRSFNLKIKE